MWYYARVTIGNRKGGCLFLCIYGECSGISIYGNKYGSQYHTILKSGNIKFVAKNSRTSETLLETRTRGRVYVEVGGDELLSIKYFDNNLKKTKRIDLDHSHKGLKPHVQHGYFGNEVDVTNGVKKGATRLTTKEKKMVSRVTKLWYNHLKNR